MNHPRLTQTLAAVTIVFGLPAALAQAQNPVELTAPVKLSGRWNFQHLASDIWSVQIRKIDADGRIEGDITYWGRRCKTRDQALKAGSWRDGVLRLTAHGGADCGDMHFELKSGGRRLLEGTNRSDNFPDTVVEVWLDK